MINKFIIVFFLIGNLTFLQAQASMYFPVRQGNDLFLSKRPFSTSSGKIKIDSLDFQNTTNYYYVAKKNNFFGVIDLYGKQVLPFVYESAQRFDNQIVLWKNGAFNYLISQDLKYSKIPADSVNYFKDVLYYYQNGLCGLINGKLQIKPEFKAIRPFQLGVNRIDNKDERDFYLAVMPNNDYQLLDKKGRALLPKGVTQINEISFGIIRFFDGIWKYYLPKRDLIISSFGYDVIFYSQDSYKKYNEKRTQSTLYKLDENRKFTGHYDDYFPLLNKKYLAVRKGNLVGIIDAYSEALVVPLKYQQINSINLNSNEFRCYNDNLCGLINTQNEELVPMEYHNVQPTQMQNFYITYKNKKAGLVKRGGEVLLPNEYDAISSQMKCLILKKNGNYGLADYKGELLCPTEYMSYKTHFFNGQHFFEFISTESRVLYTESGKFFPKPYYKAIFGNDCVKIYSTNQIDVFYLNKQGEVEETFVYKNIPSIRIGEEAENAPYYLDVAFDELEENQQTGKYGKRFFAQRGMSVEPIYTTIIQVNSNGIVFGERTSKPYTYDFAPQLTLQSNLSWNYVAANCDYEFSMNEQLNESYMLNGMYETYRIKDQSYGAFYEKQCSRKFDRMEGKILYNELIGLGAIRKITHGSHVSIVAIEKSDLSLYDYYLWANNLGIMTVKPEDLIYIMNPKIGVKFNNPKYLVCEAEPRYKFDKRDYFYTCPNFEEFEFYPEMLLKYIRENNKGRKFWEIITYINENERKNIFFDEKYQLVESTTILAKELKVKAEIHPSFPKFPFMKNRFNLDYHHGIIIQKIDSNSYRLIKPDNTVVLNNLEKASYIINGLYLVKQQGTDSQGIYALEKNAIVQNNVAEISNRFENYIQVRLSVSSGSLIYCTSKGEVSSDIPTERKPHDLTENSNISISAWEIYQGTTLTSKNLVTNWKIKAIDNFYVLYWDKYFYVLDNNFNLISD